MYRNKKVTKGLLLHPSFRHSMQK